MKVLITPHDIAGQMGILARGLRSIGVDAWSVDFGGRSDYLKFDLDEVVELGRGNRAERLVRAATSAQRLLRKYDVFHYFFGRSMLPRLTDVRLARRMRKPLVVHFRGRDVTTVTQTIAYSGAMRTPDLPLPVRGSAHQSKLVAQWRKLASALLISTPDLWREVPDAIWVPQAIELERWPYRPRWPRAGETIVVGHAPTNMAMKGTVHIENAIRMLQRQGVDIRLELIAGIPPTEVRARMEQCHLGVDQVIQGAYGNVTLQFMALGRPTLNYLDPIYEERDIQVPTVRTNPATISEDLVKLLTSPGELESVAAKGRAYAESVHSADVIAERLHGIYEAALVGAELSQRSRQALSCHDPG